MTEPVTLTFIEPLPKDFRAMTVFPTKQPEPKDPYQGFVFSIKPTQEQWVLLDKLQSARSNAVHWVHGKYTQFLQKQKPRSKAKRKSKKKGASLSAQGKSGAAATHGKAPLSKKRRAVFERRIKRKLLKKGFASRMINSIMDTAFALVDSKREIARKQARNLRLQIKACRDGDLKGKLMARLEFFLSQVQGRHIAIGKGDVRRRLTRIGQRLAETKALIGPLTQEAGGNLGLLQSEFNLAQAEFRLSALEPIYQKGSSDEFVNRVFTGNKTLFLLDEDGVLSLLVKLPRCVTKKKGRMQELRFPVRMKERNRRLYHAGLALKKGMHYQMILDPKCRALACYGSYKIPKGEKRAVDWTRRLSLDKNAGFLALALLHGRKIIKTWKVKLRQKGTSEEREAEIHKACRELVAMAVAEGCPICMEDLDLTGRASLRSRKGNRKIFGIPYGKVSDILSKYAHIAGIPIRMVNPFMTSQIGKVNYPGMAAHYAAAVMIGLRDMGLDEVRPRLGPRPRIGTASGLVSLDINTLSDKDNWGVSQRPVVQVSPQIAKSLQSKRRSMATVRWLLTRLGRLGCAGNTQLGKPASAGAPGTSVPARASAGASKLTSAAGTCDEPAQTQV